MTQTELNNARAELDAMAIIEQLERLNASAERMRYAVERLAVCIMGDDTPEYKEYLRQ